MMKKSLSFFPYQPKTGLQVRSRVRYHLRMRERDRTAPKHIQVVLHMTYQRSHHPLPRWRLQTRDTHPTRPLQARSLHGVVPYWPCKHCGTTHGEDQGLAVVRWHSTAVYQSLSFSLFVFPSHTLLSTTVLTCTLLSRTRVLLHRHHSIPSRDQLKSSPFSFEGKMNSL